MARCKGKISLSECNSVGKEFLEFCALLFSIMKTCYQKKEINQGTWNAPSNKEMSHDRLCGDEG